VIIDNILHLSPLVDDLGSKRLFAFLAQVFNLSAVRVAVKTEVVEENVNFEVSVQNFALVLAMSSGESCILPAQM